MIVGPASAFPIYVRLGTTKKLVGWIFKTMQEYLTLFFLDFVTYVYDRSFLQELVLCGTSCLMYIDLFN